MLRTAQLLPPKGPLTLGFDPACFQTEPPVCYRASWQLPGPDLHRQATTSLSLSDQLLGITSNWLGARMFEARRSTACRTWPIDAACRYYWMAPNWSKRD